MALGGAGAILKVRAGDLNPGTEIGNQAGLDGAKVYVTALGGAVHMGPGLEALVLGASGWANVALVRYTNLGEVYVSRFRMADGADPTKSLAWDLSAIGTGLQRTAIVRNHGGYLLLPASEGAAGQFLQSAGAGGQPIWAAVSVANALLDGLNHTDTVAQAVARGHLIVGNSTPKWDRLPIGAASTLLRSDGSDPSWGTVNLLSAFHADTLAAAVAAGDVLIGNATPRWARLGIGSAGQVLGVSGGLPAWISNPALQHDALNHIKAIRATGCAIANGSDHLTTSGNQFAGVKQGDFVRFDIMATQVWGAAVSSVVNDNEVVLDRVNTGSSQSGRVAVFTPGDHYNSAISEANGYVPACGIGTYDAAATPGGTFQKIIGSFDWEGYESGHAPLMGFWGSTSLPTPFGFNWKKPGTAIRAYVHVNDLTGTVVLRLGNPASGDFFVYTNLAQDLLSKRLTTACKIQTDGTATYTVFQNAANQDRLGFDLTPMSALRSISVPDYAGRMHVEGAPVTFANADTTPSVSGARVFVTNNAGATTITTFDDAVNGQEITVIAGDNNTTIQNGANMKTVGGLNITLTTDDVVRFVKSGATWYQSSPVAVNA